MRMYAAMPTIVTLLIGTAALPGAACELEQKTTSHRTVILSSEPKCNTPADLIIGTVDQDLRECCHAMLFAFVG